MKIAWLMPNLHVTGGARVAVELSDRMIARGHDFYILIPSGRHTLPHKPKAQVIECGLKVRSPMLAILTGMLSMRGHLPEVDAIIACMPPYAILGRYLGYRRNIPAVNYVLNDDVHFFDDMSFIRSRLLLIIYRSLARFSIRHGTLFVNSHWTAVRAVSEGGLKPSAIITHGYNPDVFYPEDSSRDNSDTTTIITIGRHILWKGFADLIEALNLVDQKKHPFELKVITQDDLDLSAAEFPVTIYKPESDNELSGLYRTGDIFIHSSWFEGFGMPPLEAQACGLAVISTDCGGVREFLHDEENSLIVPPREPVTLARVVEKMIDEKDLRLGLAARGLDTCRDFSWERVADRFETALKELLETHK